MRQLLTLWLSFRALREWLRYFKVIAPKYRTVATPADPNDPNDFGASVAVVDPPNVIEAVATTAAAWLSSRK